MSASTQEQARAVSARATATQHEVLTLGPGAVECGIDILREQEIRSYETPTSIAGAPADMLGVNSLRGVVVPIVDLRLPWGLEAAFDAGTVTVVLNVGGRTVSAVVDTVRGVVALEAAHIKPAPEFSGAVESRHITGIGTLGEGASKRMLILTDIERLMSSADIGRVDAATRVH